MSMAKRGAGLLVVGVMLWIVWALFFVFTRPFIEDNDTLRGVLLILAGLSVAGTFLAGLGHFAYALIKGDKKVPTA